MTYAGLSLKVYDSEPHLGGNVTEGDPFIFFPAVWDMPCPVKGDTTTSTYSPRSSTCAAAAFPVWRKIRAGFSTSPDPTERNMWLPRA
jgi:hypothetical protein